MKVMFLLPGIITLDIINILLNESQPSFFRHSYTHLIPFLLSSFLHSPHTNIVCHSYTHLIQTSCVIVRDLLQVQLDRDPTEEEVILIKPLFRLRVGVDQHKLPLIPS